MSRTDDYARRVEAQKELDHLKERYANLRQILTPTAIMAVWLLLGDEMWVVNEGAANAAQK